MQKKIRLSAYPSGNSGETDTFPMTQSFHDFFQVQEKILIDFPIRR